MAEERAVELYVYDLSQGLARQFSQALLGTYIDAVYHTSIVIGSNEFYYGHGIQCSRPGRTHHGDPMQKVQLGYTALPDEVIVEYLESLKSIYSPESYDLFMHNCNNFSNDLSVFLTGNPIPDSITSLPSTILQTPFGQMLRPQIEAALRPITTAQTVSPSTPLPSVSGAKVPSPVKIAKSVDELELYLRAAEKFAAIVFFTSATCGPCRMVAPHFETLATETGEKVSFIKIDVGMVSGLNKMFTITATPTFITFAEGEIFDEWQGGNVNQLKLKINELLQITYPAHEHTKRDYPFISTIPKKPRIFAKVPPIDKIKAKLGTIAEKPAMVSIIEFLQKRASEGAIETPLPALNPWAEFLVESIQIVPADQLFPVIDLFRATLVDPRVSGWFFEEHEQRTIKTLLDHVNTLGAVCPYPLCLVSLQLLCNLFTSPLFPPALCHQPLCEKLTLIIATSLLDVSHTATREAAATLAFNLAIYIQEQRTSGKEAMEEDSLVELFVSVLEAIQREGNDGTGSPEALMLLLASAFLVVYQVPNSSELITVMTALQAASIVRAKKEKFSGREIEGMVNELAGLLE